MSKIIAIVVVCSFLLAIQAMSLRQDVSTRVVVGNLTEYLRTQRNGRYVIEMEKRYGPHQQIIYSTGKRIQGDRIVGTSSQSNSWSQPQDVTFSLNYPQSGKGSIVTYVQVNVNQSSTNGRSIILAGGIGQRNITIAIEAKNTTYFQQNSQIYGY